MRKEMNTETQHTNIWLATFAELVELIRERKNREPTERELAEAFEAAVDGKE